MIRHHHQIITAEVVVVKVVRAPRKVREEAVRDIMVNMMMMVIHILLVLAFPNLVSHLLRYV